MTDQPDTVRTLLRDAERYLSALHGSVARHDNLAANLGCGGCELHDRLAAELRAEPSSAWVAPATNQTAPSRRAGLRDEIVKALGRIKTIPPVAHRQEQADHVLAVLYREWPWLRAEAEDAAVLPASVDRADVLREAVDVAREEGHRLEAEAGIEAARGARSVAYLLRKLLAKAQPAVGADAAAEPADETGETRGATAPQPTVKASSVRYAEELRRTPGEASADGHAGWECTAGASLIVRAETPGPGRLGTHHGAIYACTEHQAAAEERITDGGYQPQTDPAPAGHRWDPWPCGHITAYNTRALTALQRSDGDQGNAAQALGQETSGPHRPSEEA